MRTASRLQTSVVRSGDGTPIAYHTVGKGSGLIVVGGTLRTSDDYLRLAQALAPFFSVHVVDRRGRGRSGPLGDGYSIENECRDLLAVQADTGATFVFGHSYGGFVALETARRSTTFAAVAVYEPGVSAGGSIPVGWMSRYRELLGRGDTRGAFACMVRGSGFAPTVVAKMPRWYVRFILALALRGEKWHRMESLLTASLAEHEQEVRTDDGTVDRFANVSARVLLLGGEKSPRFITSELFDKLGRVLPRAETELLAGLDHFAPDDRAPEVVGNRLLRFFAGTDS